MTNNNWMRSISKTYQQLNEINVVPMEELKGASMTVFSRGTKPDRPVAGRRSMESHFYDTGVYHAQQGLDPHPEGVNDPHYMAGYNSVKKKD